MLLQYPTFNAAAPQHSAGDARSTLRGQLRNGGAGILVGGLIGFVLLALAGSAGFLRNAQREAGALARASMTVAQVRSDEFNQAFRSLHALGAIPCSPAHLAALRAVTFRSSMVRDIAYHGSDGVGCSALSDEASIQLPDRKPDFVAEQGRSIWGSVDVPTAPGVSSSLLQEGPYRMLILPSQSPDVVRSKPYRLSIVLINRSVDTALVVAGPATGLAARDYGDGRTFWQGATLRSIACVSRGSTCYALGASASAILKSHAFALAVVGLLGLIGGAVAAAAVLAMRFRAGTIEHRLQGALARNELSMVYQPVVDSRTGAAVSAEALMRWSPPGEAPISPATFIPVAERIGLISALTCFALRQVQRDLGDYLRETKDFKVSVNVVSSDLVNEELFIALAELQACGVRPSQIALELVERSPVASKEEIAAMCRLNDKGYQLHIDDFGTGYSNLSYLSELPIHKIKIDKSFTDALLNGSIRSRMVPMIIDLCRELHLGIIVEGVEYGQQRRYFESRGVYLMQGWLFGHAVTAQELIENIGASAYTVDAAPPIRVFGSNTKQGAHVQSRSAGLPTAMSSAPVPGAANSLW